MRDDQEDWFWRGVSLGLVTAGVIVERSNSFSQALAEIRSQQKRVDGRQKASATARGEDEYQSWIAALRGDREVASWTVDVTDDLRRAHRAFLDNEARVKDDAA